MISKETDGLTQYRERLIKENGLNYSLYTRVYMDMLYWHRMLITDYDIYGLASRVCCDISNRILSSKIMITTADEAINKLIDIEVFDRLDIMSILNKHLPHILGIGNGLLVVNRSPIDHKPTINVISGYNVIPKEYDKSQVYSTNWLDLYEQNDNVYILKVTEKRDRREVEVLSTQATDAGKTIIQNNLGNSLFFQFLSGKQVEKYIEGGHKKFAWISTGLINARWEDTPFNKGFCFPVECYRAIEEDIVNNNREHSKELSAKRVFVKPDVLLQTQNWYSTNEYDYGMISNPDLMHCRPNLSDQLFQSLDLKEEHIKEYNPEIRENYAKKLHDDWQLLGLILGLGHDFYNMDKPSYEVTATQVLLEHQSAYLTFKTIIYNLATAIKTVILALSDYWLEDKLITPEQWQVLNYDSIGVKFDDGVFVNKTKKLDDALRLRNSNCLSLKTLLTEGYDMSPDRADIEIKQIQAEQAAQLEMQMALEAKFKKNNNSNQ